MVLDPVIAHLPVNSWASSWQRLALATAVTIAFALLARRVRGVNRSGAVAGGLACFLMFAGAGPTAFATLAGLFLVTWAATLLGYRRKLGLGLAESREGRNARQVLANLAVPALASAVFSATGNRAWLVALVAALSETATDTVASEIGQYRSRDARFITTWKKVPAGTDGGVTIPGSVAGIVAGFVISAIATGGGFLSLAQLWIPVSVGFAGMIIDSVLGASLQRRGWIGNQTVNLLATLAAASLAYGISVFLRV
jgi:uncharacterized protein (TIGR00297 family)